MDSVTWIATGESVAEVRVRLEQAARGAIQWGQHNGASFDVAKTEAILFSRNRRHWRDKAQSNIRINPHRVPFNR